MMNGTVDASTYFLVNFLRSAAIQKPCRTVPKTYSGTDDRQQKIISQDTADLFFSSFTPVHDLDYPDAAGNILSSLDDCQKRATAFFSALRRNATSSIAQPISKS